MEEAEVDEEAEVTANDIDDQVQFIVAEAKSICSQSGMIGKCKLHMFLAEVTRGLEFLASRRWLQSCIDTASKSGCQICQRRPECVMYHTILHE